MSDVPVATRAQTTFLRAFRANPSGPPPGDWPSPAILRRWLRRPAFRAALRTLQSAVRFQTDFLISSAAACAARTLDHHEHPPTSRQLSDILRLAHLRHRFDATTPDPQPEKSPRQHMLTIPPKDRLSKEEFRNLALDRGFVPHLEQIPQFPLPPPIPQDTFYYNLLHDPHALLWWMKLYTEASSDKRYARLLERCQDIIPRHILRYPQFAKSPATSTPPQNGGSKP